jgi:DNA-binding Lrp family transcriptional regulator
MNIEMWQFNRKYLFSKEDLKRKDVHFYGKGGIKDVDKIDNDIIKYMAHNGRKSNSEIERVIGVSRKVIGYRIRNMIKNNLILGFRPIIDMDILGLSYFRILIKLQAMTEIRLKQLFSYLKGHPNIVFLIKSIGSWELEIEVEIENSRRCHELVMEIKHDFFDIIAETQILEIFTYLKYEYPIY